MAVLEIRTLPDPILRKKSKRVKNIDSSVHKLIADMLETLHAVEGRAGLAAPQVGVSQRVIVIGVPDEPDLILINPEILRRSGERTVSEGCLSIPGFFGEIVRSEKVTVKGLDRNGKEIRVKATELLAEALEHEVDHLNGILFIDHMESPDQLQKVEDEEEESESENIGGSHERATGSKDQRVAGRR